MFSSLIIHLMFLQILIIPHGTLLPLNINPVTENADFTDAYIGQFDIKNLCKNPTLKVRMT